MNFPPHGTNLVLYSPSYGHLYLISQYHQKQLELLATEQILAMISWKMIHHSTTFVKSLEETFPVVVVQGVATLWGQRRATKLVEFCSDNTAVVSILRSGTLKDPNTMVLRSHL